MPITGHYVDGITTISLADWAEFHAIIERLERPASEYIWRGQRDPRWPLEPSLDRRLRAIESEEARSALWAGHLERFQKACRGRRGPNPEHLDDNDAWWALGQHYGLLTPLLDWTGSPYAAVFFAFREPNNENPFRAVYALNRRLVQSANKRLERETAPSAPQEIVELQFVDPRTDDNPRLFGQGGSFTKAPDGVSVEDWVRSVFGDDQSGSEYPVLLKLLVAEGERDRCMRALELMNLNYHSLYPDLLGTSLFSNSALEAEIRDLVSDKKR